MIITLLTHPHEFSKTTNTGRLACTRLTIQAATACYRVPWQRKQPNQDLLARLKKHSSGLMYPSPDAIKLSTKASPSLPEHIVIIDSTWQQARKIYNHSPYIQELPCYALTDTEASRFTMRRNQLEGGLCTLETVAALAKLNNLPQLAESLYRDLDQLQS
ncbi:tRNA-uridine aminocarboxypropyltransferase [Gilvimarinus sp. SDUM040013]|uniref:tRNA-uridine aminocarboxypropyltransferase n=1 Tax=Gilvimarinus gilvus TaxID=3058038 RepID=A0ABU4RZF5_9GAMM|nr:tRNA-uridine aminocarboxypropyltransferase [Gilvimarinus sp. SDUM040013]MDO3384657.1 tRNA-uridine aminocarboxypropyltransferase [Gilvimarinus sp. SDUM040013]MDX6850243.1 tRNA-uridine aminocarboxypropyltransferase [Gilvimarinus sp. SDUM040013]